MGVQFCSVTVQLISCSLHNRPLYRIEQGKTHRMESVSATLSRRQNTNFRQFTYTCRSIASGIHH